MRSLKSIHEQAVTEVRLKQLEEQREARRLKELVRQFVGEALAGRAFERRATESTEGE